MEHNVNGEDVERGEYWILRNYVIMRMDGPYNVSRVTFNADGTQTLSLVDTMFTLPDAVQLVRVDEQRQRDAVLV